MMWLNSSVSEFRPCIWHYNIFLNYMKNYTERSRFESVLTTMPKEKCCIKWSVWEVSNSVNCRLNLVVWHCTTLPHIYVQWCPLKFVQWATCTTICSFLACISTQIFISDLDKSLDHALTNFPNDAKVRMASNTRKDQNHSSKGDCNRLECWAQPNQIKFNKGKWDVLLLRFFKSCIQV